MNISVEEKNGIKIIKFEGEFSVFFQDEIEDVINENIKDFPADKLIFDLSKVNYLDSSGISMIVTTAQKMKGKINLAECQPNVKYVLELAEIEEIVKFYDTLEQAINDLK
jgi:anti-anti-sigma factor